jgi:superfamily I DNA/RNA helicase
MEALLEALDDDWTIYVQPFLNGLQPDIIIFSEQAGLGIFEVKDWNLDHYRVSAGGMWSVYNSAQDRWHNAVVRCPLAQVRHYKETIIRYELPELDAESTLDNHLYALVATFVYFHCHTSKEAMVKTASLQEEHPYVGVFGHDWLNPEMLGKVLRQHRLEKGSLFTDFMQRHELRDRLHNALSYPEHGRLDVDDILFDLPKDQKHLLSNAPGKKRVIGSAGSGKTLIVARKAVNAAQSGQIVLVACFNITMVNYLSDVVRRLARYKSHDGDDIGRRILVRHYHRLFPDGAELGDPEVQSFAPFDVILVDEGQDFSREWLQNLFELSCGDNAHVMFLEDDRQNIYGVDAAARRAVPGIVGRPNLLRRSFRLSYEIAAVANRLIALSKREFESSEMESAKPRQVGLFRPAWTDGTAGSLLPALAAEVERLSNGSDTGAPADTVILVCSKYDGWEVCDYLDTLNVPHICNFESREEHQRLEKLYSGERLEWAVRHLNRGRKLAFRMQTGRIKVCTIHSFKGWELRRVLVYFHPNEKQFEDRVPLLYTAITRAQESLTIFNADRTLSRFGQIAAAEGLLTLRQLEPSAPEPVPMAQPSSPVAVR